MENFSYLYKVIFVILFLKARNVSQTTMNTEVSYDIWIFEMSVSFGSWLLTYCFANCPPMCAVDALDHCTLLASSYYWELIQSYTKKPSIPRNATS